VAAHDKESRTEKPTGKRLSKARKDGQVAKSIEVNHTAVLIAAIVVLSLEAPRMVRQMLGIVHDGLSRSGRPQQLVEGGVGLHALYMWGFHSLATVLAPVLLAVAATGVAASVAQVGFRFSSKALQPSFARLNPASGLKRLVGPRALVELGKSLAKLAIIGGVAAAAVWTRVGSLAGLVGLPPGLLLGTMGSMVMSIAIRVAAAMALIAAIDYGYQRRSFMRSLRMTKDEVKREAREADLAPEVRGQLRRRQFETAKRRMLQDVPDADVVVVNPTHYAVALRYDGSKPAPELVAKGVDHLAHTIREIAEEAGVTIVHAPPLARALYRDVDLGQLVPEELFQAVAEVLAFVFRTAGRRRRVA
jgi:flagellar biosynthesis protein FlhB